MKAVLVSLSCLVVVAVVAAIGVEAAVPAPTLVNDVCPEGTDDLVLDAATYEEVLHLAPTWTVTIPWSRDGLGGSDQYLGELALGLPVPGGAARPLATVVGPGPVVAIEDRGASRLYDASGRVLAVVPGHPVGFGPRGQFVVAGGLAPLVVYGPDGIVSWQRDPWREAYVRLGIEREAALGLVQGQGWACCAPSGEIYWSMRLEVGSIVSVPNPDNPGATISEFRTRETLEALVVFGQNGDVIRCTLTAMPTRLVFTPDGTVYGCSVPRPDGYVHREFAVDRGAFRLHRTVRLPVDTIWGVGRDGTLLCPDALSSDAGLHFSAYRETSPGRAMGFRLPAGHGFVSADSVGVLYTACLRPDAYVVCGWTWPVPD